MKMYVVEFEVTKDGSLDFTPNNMLCRQLIFTSHLTPYQQENYRWVEYDPYKLSRQDISAVEIWEQKFGVKCEWRKLEYSNGQSHFAWVIKDDKRIVE